ncbi:hypothetical protein [Rufibacter sp. XAAS-G3-1]|uniref:hypothetical protein n=1 Tax=Rufibacter sp. XAAS-G3-1 TaxID=2729134 RepID=UPI0015E675C4|nr:hypothetical protein [Rufibacter sp. XAAS-G3-1]
MKITLLLFPISVLTSFMQPDSKFWQAGEALVQSLRSQSPKFDNVSLRTYAYEDLNSDNQYEIIEKVNKVEEEATGLLNLELSPAFELHRIFTYSGGKFQRDYSKFSWYLEKRVHFYESWRRQILNPISLSTDSQQLIKANRADFLKEVDRLITLTKSLKK